MERKIGEIFEYEGKILRVKEVEGKICKGCLFLNKCTCEIKKSVGWCGVGMRSDKKDVIFVEAKDIAHETEAVKERKIGETFKYDGKTLEVVETKSDTCYQCCFKEETGRCSRIKSKTGVCDAHKRSDRRPVIFVEVKDKTKEQPQQTKPHQKLNLCEILKNCPENEQFWSPMLGDVIFYGINQSEGIVRVEMENGEILGINADGTITICGITSQEIMLFPSREQRDWSKVKHEPKKEKFDPKTLNAFDKVIARKDSEDSWNIDFFSCFKLTKIPLCLGGMKCAVIPYNDDTKHLIGTTKEAPDFYRYWED